MQSVLKVDEPILYPQVDDDWWNESYHLLPNNQSALNETTKLSNQTRVILTAVVTLVIVFIITGNALTITTIIRFKQIRTVTNLYIASLATADLLVGSVVMTFMLLYNITFGGVWVFGSFLCDVWTFVDYVSCTASLTNVCLIAIDRFLTVSRPLKAIKGRTKKRAGVYILLAWLVPIMFWLTMICLLRATNGYPPSDGSTISKCYLVWRPPLLALLSVVSMMYVPICIILVLFAAIMLFLRGHMRKMSRRLRRSNSAGSVRSTETIDSATASRTGGISFNPRYSVNISMSIMAQCNAGEIVTHHRASQVSADAILEITHRSIGVNTSPERYGLVRTVATNTSPSLGRRNTFPELHHSPDSEDKVAVELLHKRKVDAPSHKHKLSLAGSSQEGWGDTESDIESLSWRSTSTNSSGSTPRTRSTSRDTDSISESVTTRYSRHQRYGSLLRAERHQSLERARLRQQLKAAKTLGVITTFLLLSWMPFAILWPVRVFCPDCVSETVYNTSFWVNYMNSAINPIIYCLCNANFRQAFRRMLPTYRRRQ
jgi:hypothetical protein